MMARQTTALILASSESWLSSEDDVEPDSYREVWSDQVSCADILAILLYHRSLGTTD